LPIILRGAGAFDFLEDVAGFGGPDERLGMFVVMVNIIEDRSNQLLDAVKGAAAQAVLGQVAEETLHHVQPGATGGGKVHMEAGMAAKPALDPGMLMCRVVVHDHVDLLVLWNNVIDGAQELQPFLMAVPVVAHGDDLAFQRVQSRKQCGRAVALVVVGHGSATAFLHWQAGLGAVQRLNLALLVGAQHDGIVDANLPYHSLLGLASCNRFWVGFAAR